MLFGRPAARAEVSPPPIRHRSCASRRPGRIFSLAFQKSSGPRLQPCSEEAAAGTIRFMRVLYHLTLSPLARKLRIVLAEKNLEFTLKLEKVWERRPEFLALNPAGEVPVLIEPDGTVLAGTEAIVEYLDEAYREKLLIGIDPVARAEVRRLTAWLDIKMNFEVTENLLGQKMMRRYDGHTTPNSQAIRAGHANLPYHLDYIGYLVERRRWLAGDHFSVADVAAAAHLSSLDYLGDVPWEAHASAKEWYARIKSRPSFRQILADHVPGAPPPKHYADLDF